MRIFGELAPFAEAHEEIWLYGRRCRFRCRRATKIAQSDSPQGGFDKASLAADVHGVMEALGFERYAVCGLWSHSRLPARIATP
jgi:hypothetical protein